MCGKQQETVRENTGKKNAQNTQNTNKAHTHTKTKLKDNTHRAFQGRLRLWCGLRGREMAGACRVAIIMIIIAVKHAPLLPLSLHLSISHLLFHSHFKLSS